MIARFSMNVYEVEIWCSVWHNCEFSHNVARTDVIHALNEERALKKVTLVEGKVQYVDTLELRTSNEFIYNVKKTGTVTKRLYYEYSDGRIPRPVNSTKRNVRKGK